jgi:hypothetical protein
MAFFSLSDSISFSNLDVFAETAFTPASAMPASSMSAIDLSDSPRPKDARKSSA